MTIFEDEPVSGVSRDTPSPLTQRVFPPGDPRDGNILRLDDVQTWESQFLGIGRTVRVLSENVLRRNFAADDLGLSLVFLQRHRVEVGLKLVLERTEGTVARGHKLTPLMETATHACRQSGLGPEWDAFVGSQDEFLRLMDTADEGAATYRYPVDTSGTTWSRHPYVDVDELEKVGEKFERDLLEVVYAAEHLEPLPPAIDAKHALEVLTALSDAARAAATGSRDIMGTMRSEHSRLGGKANPRDGETNVIVASDAVAEVTNALASRVDRMAARLAAISRTTVTRAPAPAIPVFPRFDLSKGRVALRHQQEAQIKWVADAMLVWMRPLAIAIRAAEALTGDWSTPAARQLHLDIARFRSRFGAAAPQIRWSE